MEVTNKLKSGWTKYLINSNDVIENSLNRCNVFLMATERERVEWKTNRPNYKPVLIDLFVGHEYCFLKIIIGEMILKLVLIIITKGICVHVALFVRHSLLYNSTFERANNDGFYF